MRVSAFYEHYWNPAWRTSVFGNYSYISYGARGDALLLGAPFSTGTLNATGSFALGLTQIGTRTAWTPVKNLTLSAEFVYSHMDQHLNGIFTANAGSVPGYGTATSFILRDQNLYNGAVQILAASEERLLRYALTDLRRRLALLVCGEPANH